MPPEWLNDIWESLLGPPRRRRVTFRRRMRLGREAVAWLQDPVRTDEERWAFADLLLRLDSDPFTHSTAMLVPGTAPGLRWTGFDGWRVVIRFNPVEDRITVYSIRLTVSG